MKKWQKQKLAIGTWRIHKEPVAIILGKLEYEGAGKVFGGLATIKMKNQWGYAANQDGNLRMVIPPRFLQARDFSEILETAEHPRFKEIQGLIK